MWIIYVSIIICTLTVGPTLGSSKQGWGASGDMKCPPGQIFAITYFNDTIERLEMRCMPAMICGAPGLKTGRTQNCRRDGEFMHSADEKGIKSGNVIETCNQYKLPPKKDYEQICVTLLVDDRVATNQRKRKRRSVWNSKATFKSSIDKENFIRLNLATSVRQKRSVSHGKTDVYVGKSSKSVQMAWFVKDIERQSKNYQVIGCQVTCRDEDEKENPEHPENSEFYDQYRSEGRGSGGNGGGGAGPSCFTADETVETLSGSVRMDQLKIGDKIMTFSSKLSVYALDEVQYFLHRDPEKKAQFVTIETKSGRSLSLTSEHLIPLAECRQFDIVGEPDLARRMHNDYARPAREANVGQCVIVKNDDQQLILDEITKISSKTQFGIYSPVTRQHNLIVNGVHASCFSEFEQNTVVKAVFGVYQGLLDCVSGVMTGGSGSMLFGDTMELPYAVRVFLEAGKML